MDSDELLFDRLCAGDMAAFDRLYERFERPLFGFLRARLGDAHEAEDVLQDAFLAILRERDKRTRVRSVRAWLFGVAHHACLNRLRARKRVVPIAAEGEIAPGPDLSLEEQERTRHLAGALERLPSALAEIYHLRASGMSYEDMADATELPLGTVKSRMHELVRRLREEMAR